MSVSRATPPLHDAGGKTDSDANRLAAIRAVLDNPDIGNFHKETMRFVVGLLAERDADIARLLCVGMPIDTLRTQAAPGPETKLLHDRKKDRRYAAIEAKLREVERVLYEDTNASDDPCCGWGPLWHEIRDVLGLPRETKP